MKGVARNGKGASNNQGQKLNTHETQGVPLKLPHYERGRQLPGISHTSGILPDCQKMLRGSHNNVGTIPKEVGDMLQGQQFKTFDQFRSAFWKTVAQTKYAQEFSAVNIERMSVGKSPFVLPEQAVGKRVSYEIHHKTPIVHEGSIYDLSNMLLSTPRAHLEILDKKYHFGGVK